MNEDLKRKLETWKVTPAVPKGFHRQVWQRIAAGEAAEPLPGLRRLSQRFFEVLATPRHAAAACVTAILIGVGAAEFRANLEMDRRWSELQTRYAISIDPAAQAFSR